MSLNDSVLLKVPHDMAEQYEQIAEDEGLTGRAPWAMKARQVLKQYLDGTLVFASQGTEQDAALAEEAVPAEA